MKIKMADPPFRIAVIGAGRIAQKMVDSLKKSNEIMVVAIASRNAERAEAFAQKNSIPNWFSSYDSLICSDGYDLIYIATVNSTHYEIARKCLENNKPVVIEKPICLDSEQTKELLDLSAKNKVFLAEAMPLRYCHNMIRTAEYVRNGFIGNCFLLFSNIGIGCWQEERINNPVLGGGALYDLGVYGLTLSRMLFPNEIMQISAQAHMDNGVDADDTVIIKHENGQSICFNSVKNQTRENAILYGTHGVVYIRRVYDSQRIFLYAGLRNIRYLKKKKNTYLEEMECFMNAIKHGDIETSEYTHREILECAIMIDSVRKDWDR